MNNRQLSPLLRLPLELRLQIYDYLLHIESYSPSCLTEPHVHAGILQTNRQIHEEAWPMLYQDNLFEAHPKLLDGFPRLRPWYAPIREAAAAQRIRRFRLVIRLECEIGFDKDKASAAFSGLDELVVEVVQTIFMGAGCDNLRVLEGVRGVRNVLIRGSTSGFEDYVEWLAGVMTTQPGEEASQFVPGDRDAWGAHMHIMPWPTIAPVVV